MKDFFLSETDTLYPFLTKNYTHINCTCPYAIDN